MIQGLKGVKVYVVLESIEYRTDDDTIFTHKVSVYTTHQDAFEAFASSKADKSVIHECIIK